MIIRKGERNQRKQFFLVFNFKRLQKCYFTEDKKDDILTEDTKMEPSWLYLFTLHKAEGLTLEACLLSHFSHVWLCHPMDCISPGSSVCRIFWTRILERVAIFCSRGSSSPRDRTQVSCISCIGRWILYHWKTTLMGTYILSWYSAFPVEERPLCSKSHLCTRLGWAS